MRDFCLIIGAARSGTSSLYTALHNCSGIAPSRSKELHIFDKPIAEFKLIDIEDYESCFEDFGVCLEATPSYLFLPTVPKRVKSTIPNARFIVLLRNPIDRAFSHYAFIQRAHWVRKRRPDKVGLTFEDAVTLELQGEIYETQQDYLDFAYLSRGYYARQLECWFTRFPRDRFLVIRSEDYFTHPDAVSLECLLFALNSREFQTKPDVVNEYKSPYTVKDYGSINAPMREKLSEHFYPHNARLQHLLDRDFGWD